MRFAVIGLIGLIVAMFAAVVVASVFGEPTYASAKPALWRHGMVDASAQRLSLTIRSAPRSAASDERVDEPNIAVRPGDAVTVTVQNYTPRFHTFTIPSLGVSALIKPGHARHATRTTFTFTVNRFGTFRWFCALPCGGYMGGTVYAIVGEPAA
jgi:plastocyanin